MKEYTPEDYHDVADEMEFDEDFEKEEGCTFPDCGCPEARLCMAGNPNYAARSLNRPRKEPKP